MDKIGLSNVEKKQNLFLGGGWDQYLESPMVAKEVDGNVNCFTAWYVVINQCSRQKLFQHDDGAR